MEIQWIIIAVVVVLAITLVIYLIIRNQKDEKEVVKFLNETEDEPELKEKDES